MKKRSSMKGPSADSEVITPAVRWLARIVGVGLAALLIGAFMYGQGPDIATIAFWTVVFVSIVIAFFWKGIGGVTVVRWLARALGVGLAAGIVAFGLFDAWAALIVNLIHGGSGPEPGGPGILGVLEWIAVFVGILIAFFWEGIGGAIVALAALAIQLMDITTGGPLQPLYLVFVFDGLAFVYCWWRTRRLSSSKDTSTLPPPPVHERGIQSHRWRLFTQLTVVVLLVAGLTWRVVLHLQPPPPPPADCGQPADAARSGAVAQFCFPKLTPQFGQGSMTAGPDGSVWFTEGQKIARITPAGALTEFPVPPPDVFITAGPDGNLWFSGMGPKIVRMSTHGDVREFALPKLSHDPAPLIVGPDGNLWFTEGQGVGKFAKMTLTGQITEFSLPFEVRDLAPASDGNLWFVADSLIGRITPSGVVITKFPMATDKIDALAAGPDGNLWFLENDGHVGRITLAGEVKRFPAFEPTNPAFSVIIAGPDGNLWFSAQPGKIGRITPSGAVTLFPLPPKAQIGGLAAGSDGRVWFLRSDTDTSGIFWWTQVGCITP